MRNIILADNQDITRAGLNQLLSEMNLEVQFQIASNKTAIQKIIENEDSSIIILDYNLFNYESANELIMLNSIYPKIDWIIFSDELTEDFLVDILFNANSFGVLLKSCSSDEIKTALKEAFAGRRYICNHISNLMLDMTKRKNDSKSRDISLTTTEKEILKEIALGKTTKEIAAQRFVSAHTIMTHRKNIFRKIQVNNIHEATKYAMRAGIVEFAEYYI